MDWEKTKFGLLSAVGGAIALAVIGFNWGGWMTTGTAEAMAKENAATAVAQRLGSICLAQFNKDSQKGQKLTEMKGQDTWDIGRYIEKQSWAIMPGDEKPDSGVADACAKHFAKQVS
jgi:dienelactone hydrolase